MIEEQQRTLYNIIFKTPGNVLKNVFMYFLKKEIHNTVQQVTPNRKLNVKSLLKNNKGAGIHVEKNIDKPLAKALEKELIKHNQDYVISKDGDNYKITVLGANKVLLDELKEKCRNSMDKPKKVDFKKGIEVFRKHAQIQKQKSNQRMQEHSTPTKHKQISLGAK